MNSKTILLPLITLLIILFSNQLHASENDPLWLEDRVKLEELTSSQHISEENCQAVWNILWSWAKKGNMEARSGILGVMYAFGLEFPGRSGDTVSRMRDAVILGVHSVGSEPDEFVDNFISGIRGYPGSDKFLECIHTNRSQECVNILVENRVVPSFEDFASEVDMLMASGKKVSCGPPTAKN
jgi:hypothetical protein